MRLCTIEGCDRKHYGRGYCYKHWSRVRATGDPNTVRTGHRYQTSDPARRLRERSVPRGECVVYEAGRPSRSGHRTMGFNGKNVGVHRVSWMLANGPIPDGMCVCHRCDVPNCINVEHLFIGTVADNNADRDAKGRQVSRAGSKHGRAKLSEWQVIEIRSRYAAGGVSQQRLADEYGVSQSLIDYVLHHGWTHIKPDDRRTPTRTAR